MLGIDVLERQTNVGRDLVHRLDLERAVADHPHGDLLVELPLVRAEARQELVPVVLRLDRPDVRVNAFEEDLERSLVRDGRLEAMLRSRVAPARVDPDLS